MSAQPQQIPLSLQPYFQEYDLANLNLRQNANLIIQRTLEYGTWDEVRWLFQVYTRQRIEHFLRESIGRGGSNWLPSTIGVNYWAFVAGNLHHLVKAKYGILEQSHWAPFGSVLYRF